MSFRAPSIPSTAIRRGRCLARRMCTSSAATSPPLSIPCRRGERRPPHRDVGSARGSPGCAPDRRAPPCPRHADGTATEGFQTLKIFPSVREGSQRAGSRQKPLFATITDLEKLERKTENVANWGPYGVMSFEAVAAARAWLHDASVGRRPAAMEAAALPSKQRYCSAELWGRQAGTVQGQPAAIDRFAVAENSSTANSDRRLRYALTRTLTSKSKRPSSYLTGGDLREARTIAQQAAGILGFARWCRLSRLASNR